MNFAFTDISLEKVYQMSYNQALQTIQRNGGTINEDSITIRCQQPVPVRYEESFRGMFPKEKQSINKSLNDINELTFEGNGIVFKGYVNSKDEHYVAQVEMYLDGQLTETANLPASFTQRRHELFWKYQLPAGKHSATFKWLNPTVNANIQMTEMLVYDAEKQQ